MVARNSECHDPHQEPARTMRDILADLTAALQERRPCVFCSVVETRGSTPQKAGAAMLVFADGTQREEGGAPADIPFDLMPLEQRPRPASRHGIAYLPVLPRITLLIVGAGHVGQAVARLAAESDFDVCVVDDREQYASRERFPTA